MASPNSFDGSALLDEAEAAYRRGDLNAAAELFAQVARASDGSQCARGIYGLGMVALSQSRTSEAFELFADAVKTDPQHANAWYQLGRLSESNRPDYARQCYERTLNIDPRHASAQQHLGAVSSSLREPPRAQGAREDQVRTVPQSAGVASPGPANEGVIANFQQRIEQTPTKHTVYVWDFRVARVGHPTVAVEMRGYRFEGSLANGDHVRLPASVNTGKVLRLTRLENLSTNSDVRITKRPRASTTGLFYLFRTVFIVAWLAAAIAIGLTIATHM